MPLNPVKFAADVINQFGRYLKTTFPIADPGLAAQMDEALHHRVGGQPLLYRGPYVTLNRAFEPGPPLDALIGELGLHPALGSTFHFETLHKHQELALRESVEGKHIILSTGTGSGKTEAFLLPIFDHCLRMRDSNTPDGVVAVIVYPMNALVNDQLERLRPILAGTRITFGRYTGETAERAGDDLNQLAQPRRHTEEERQAHRDGEPWPYPWEECVDRRSIRERKPRILLTNYTQLEYLLLQDRDLGLFRGAPLRFLVFDEVHTYTGELGSEVACLIRRLRDVANKRPEDVICIGTSATVTDNPEADNPIDGEAATRAFAHRLFGVPEERIEFITESYAEKAPPADLYTPPPPADPHGLFDRILETAADVHRQDEPGDLPPALLALAEELCGRQASAGATVNDQLYRLLAGNHLARRLEALLARPKLLEEVLPALRQLDGRQHADDDTLVAEVMAILTLGAIANQDGEPLLRPKLHYLIQGFQGLFISFEDDGLQLHFDLAGGISETGHLLLPLYLCRSCGQHYSELIAGPIQAAQVGSRNAGYRLTRCVYGFEEAATGERLFTITDHLHTQEEDEEAADSLYLCQVCGTLHTESTEQCLNPQCQSTTPLVAVQSWEDEPKRCPACGSMNWGNAKRITRARSAEVADVTILSQSLLAAMSEPSMRKLLIFADNRQDAAFQAGWMEERARRFRLRHLLYRLLHNGLGNPLGFDHLADNLLDEAEAEQVIQSSGYDSNDGRTRVRWFLLEEFASPTQQRSSLEQLGLSKVFYKDLTLDLDPEFFAQWALLFDCTAQQVVDLIWLLLDHYRQRGLLSEPLLARFWSSQDREVRRGLVATADYYRPLALIRLGGNRSGNTKGWLANNGRSATQVAVKNVVRQGASHADEFLTALWHWLLDHEYLVQVELVQRRYGRVEAIPISETTYQVNVDKIGIAETDSRWVCDTCRRAYSHNTPAGSCPGYNCRGHLELLPRDEEHFDVVQYTQLAFVPLRSHEHSAQVPKKDRERVEREFKKESGLYNTIVATPTLEMGVDIGKLEMVMMRNVPPNPANYAQRAGRAGRRHRIGMVLTYAGGGQHDRYFFEKPPEMISGQIRVPAFSMQNEPLIAKHIHSATLTALRKMVDEGERAVLEHAFPPYIWAYFGETVMHHGESRFRYLDAPLAFPDLAGLIDRYHERILERLSSIFTQTWPTEAAQAVTPEQLSHYLDRMTGELEHYTALLFSEIQRYRSAINAFVKTEQQGLKLTQEEMAQRRRFESALNSYQQEKLDNWSLGYLSNQGFFPGYALSRESVTALSLDPFLALSRPASVALRELTPGNLIYANKRVFQVQTLNFYKLRAQDREWTPDLLRRGLRLDRTHHRVFDPAAESVEGGQADIVNFYSYQLTGIEMAPEQDIDDRREYRQRMACDLYGLLLGEHRGGRGGQAGSRQFQFLRQERLWLLNLGPTRIGPASPGIGFPICPYCGETRHPRASEKEIQAFRESHQNRCKVPDILWTAIHVEMASDVLVIGPYNSEGEAVNIMEGLRIGARMVLDMGEIELDGFTASDAQGSWWTVLYDPLPGGSGFIPSILDYWPQVCDRAVDVLGVCTCDKACYSCMKHFRNQQYHNLYDRQQAIELLDEVMAGLHSEYEIPPNLAEDGQTQVGDGAESIAEEQFVAVLEERSFPLPDASQYRIGLGGLDYTVADYAYTEARLLIFIDGLSEKLHGDPAQSQRDRLKRAKARMLGYRVVEIPASAMRDSVMLGGLLEEMALYLGSSG